MECSRVSERLRELPNRAKRWYDAERKSSDAGTSAHLAEARQPAEASQRSVSASVRVAHTTHVETGLSVYMYCDGHSYSSRDCCIRLTPQPVR